MKINNIIDNNYKYTIIDETKFNNKYLLCNSDGSKYKKYLLVCYKEDNHVKYMDIPNENYLEKITNIIKIYNIEEIVSSCTNFDNMYDELNYFHIDDIYFIKYIVNEEDYKPFKFSDDYEKIEKYFIS